MRTLNQYIARSFASSFLLTVLVLTFVLSLASLFRLTDMLARGIPLSLVGRFFLWSMPALLVFAVPISVLTAVLLVFGRLSHDGELTAMRACGISLWQAARSPFLAGFLLTAGCLALNFEGAPRIARMQRDLMEQMRSDAMLNFLDAGRFQPMGDNLSVYVWRKKGPLLQRVVILEQTKGRNRKIEAAEADVEVSADGRFLQLNMREVRITPFLEGNSASGFIEQLPYRLPVKGRQKLAKLPPSSFTTRILTSELLRLHPATGSEPDVLEHQRMMVEMGSRAVMALGCLAFVFLGIPLGIRNPRRESSASVLLSLLLAFVFYLFVVVSLTLARHPWLMPHLFVWIPIPLSIILGIWLIRRMN